VYAQLPATEAAEQELAAARKGPDTAMNVAANTNQVRAKLVLILILL
jgi:hypothetical protein